MKRFLAILLLLLATPVNAAVVFMYHRFGEGEFPSTNVTLEQFEAQLDFLEREGFTVWPLPKLVAHLKEREPVPDKVVVLTVDDAYASVYVNAFPRMSKRGLPFTVFVATDAIDQGLPGYMTWAQLRELHAAGVTLANHGASHAHLVNRAQDESAADWKRRVRQDVVKGQSRLQEELGGAHVNESPRLFAYPYGEYDVAMMGMLEQMGYVAFGQHSGAVGVYDNLLALPRFPVNERYGELNDFALKARALPLPVLKVEPVNPIVKGDEAPVLTLTFGESAANLDRLACYFGAERMKVRWLGETAEISSDANLPSGRSRYNCTAPHASADRWYWYSHLWIR